MAAISPYHISISDEKLSALVEKLAYASFPDELDDAGWSRGAPLADIKRLTQYWKETYDWKKHEARINELPHFRTTIQADGFESLQIHFLHQRSDVLKAIPLLFIHGCMLGFHLFTRLF